jgi:hypothetical protein
MLLAIRSQFSVLSFACLAVLACCALPTDAQPMQINGQPIIILKRAASSNGAKPEFLSATILPGRGMNLLQITANLPGKGEIEVLATPSLDEVAKALDGDAFGNKSFSTFGGAYLTPYANRIRGTLSADGQTITTSWHGKELSLPANWSGKNPGAERHSIHGLILTRKTSAPGTAIWRCKACLMASLLGAASRTHVTMSRTSSLGKQATIFSHSSPSIRASTILKHIGTCASSVKRTESWLFFWIRMVNSRPSIFLSSRLLR